MMTSINAPLNDIVIKIIAITLASSIGANAAIVREIN
jgi:hypothetical protein